MGEVLLAKTLERVQSGDPQAFVQLYDATVSQVFALVCRITRNYADAEEVTNDVYHQLWRRARQFDPKRGSVAQWIAVIARSRALDHLRRISPSGVDDPMRGAPPYPADSVAAADEVLQSFQRGTLVRNALFSLSALQIQLIGLSFFEGLSHREIAARVRMPLGTVKSHIRRALTMLGTALTADLTEVPATKPCVAGAEQHLRLTAPGSSHRP